MWFSLIFWVFSEKNDAEYLARITERVNDMTTTQETRTTLKCNQNSTALLTTAKRPASPRVSKGLLILLLLSYWDVFPAGTFGFLASGSSNWGLQSGIQ